MCIRDRSSTNPSATRSEHSFQILADTSSGPLAFFEFSSFRSFSIPLAELWCYKCLDLLDLFGEPLSSVEKTLPIWSLNIFASFLSSVCTIPQPSRSGDTLLETSVRFYLINVKILFILLTWFIFINCTLKKLTFNQGTYYFLWEKWRV